MTSEDIDAIESFSNSTTEAIRAVTAAVGAIGMLLINKKIITNEELEESQKIILAELLKPPEIKETK